MRRKELETPLRQSLGCVQGDQIGQNFAIWAIFYGVGWNFFWKKSPNDLGKILAIKKSPKIDLNKAKILFQKRFFTCLSKIFKKISPFLCKKTIKECPVPLDISIKSNRKHHKNLYSKSNKNMVKRLFGQFFVVFGWFFHKNIWSPWLCRLPILLSICAFQISYVTYV